MGPVAPTPPFDSTLRDEDLEAVRSSADADGRLSGAAVEALADFQTTCRNLGCDALDEAKFCELLDGIGYSVGAGTGEAADAKTLFADMIAMVSAVAGRKVEVLDVEAMKSLYASTPYCGVDENANTGSALIAYVQELFEEFDKDGSGGIDSTECRQLIESMLGEDDAKELLGGAFDIDTFVASMDLDGDGNISREELCAGLLKIKQERYVAPLPRDFNVALMDPAIALSDRFCAVLGEWVNDHEAMRHHFLSNLQTGGYGSNAKRLIVQFLTAYHRFSTNFRSYVDAVRALVPEAEAVLTENHDEECGRYDSAMLAELRSAGIDPASVDGVPHDELFKRTIDAIGAKFGGITCDDAALAAEAIAPLIEAFETHVVNKSTASAASAVGALLFGSENVVPRMYKTFYDIIKGEDAEGALTKDDLAFFTLHMDMDQDHAAKLLGVAETLGQRRSGREEMMRAAQDVMEARIKVYENVIRLALHVEGDDKAGMGADKLYDAQSGNWKRTKPTCLSDFTGRPVVFETCKPFVQGANVLDLGCGEGYVARKLMEMGAQSVVGVDVSESMVASAEANKVSSKESYVQGNCATVRRTLIESPSAMGVMPGADLETGPFGLAVGCFVFNYVSISEMRSTMEDVFRLLKPGGTFVFSVPHPFMLLQNSGDDQTFGFRTNGEDVTGSYFSLRDRAFGGTIKTTAGTGLNVKMNFKTLDDYTRMLTDLGFTISGMQEARVLPEHMRENKAFFDSVKDVPLHLVFSATKPVESSTMGSSNVLDLLPKKILWNKIATNNPVQSFVMPFPSDAREELTAVCLRCYDQGIGADDFEMNVHAQVSEMQAVAEHAALVRSRLLNDVGAILVRGLDMERFGGLANLEKMTHCSKLAYYIYSSFMGQVDAGARGRLFDVKSANLDVKADNVLFSVSDTEAGWHTDGASKDRVYDVVSLLSIVKASSGGEFRIANGANALEELKLRLPKFMMYELLRPIPRDVLENGSGKGAAGIAMKLSRSEHLLAKRIKYNSYPIFVDRGERMRFRYMRFWIETAHRKVNWPISPLLKVGMDLLDEELDNSCCFNESMEPGDMIYDNNMIVAHARNAFKVADGQAPRHKVRAWLQIQKSELLANGFK